jgi:GWxTD domain-containing protein
VKLPRATAPLFCCILLLCPGAARAEPDTPPLRDWIKGPIRYLSLKEEARAFKSLETDEDRALFVERFWRRRDPSPETLTNEYRQLFWERVQQANANFIDSTKKGWMTDRGKIYILYGPPSEIQEDVHLSTEGLPAAGRGIIRWIYEGRPSERMDLDPIVVVPFVRDASGEYRVSYEPELASVFFDTDAIQTKANEDIEKFFSLVGSPQTSRLSVMLDLGRSEASRPNCRGDRRSERQSGAGHARDHRALRAVRRHAPATIAR